MNHFLRFFGMSLLLVAVAFSSPVWLAAQDKKDDPVKKKDDVKKKTDPKKDKVDLKNLPPKERVIYDTMVTAKVKKINADDPTDFTIEVMMPDPTKISNFQQWQYQQLLAINQAQPKDRFKKTYDYQIALANKSENDLLTAQDVEVRAQENVKVRTIDPPIESDEKGFQKKWTAKELTALKAGSKLPGFPSMLEYMRVGQDVQVYLLRPKMAPRKKGDDPPLREPRPEAVMIVIGPQQMK